MSHIKQYPLAWGVSVGLHIVFFFLVSLSAMKPYRKAFRELKVTYIKPPAVSLGQKTRIPLDASLKGTDLTSPGQRLVLSDRNELPKRKMSASESRAQDEPWLRPEHYAQKPRIQSSEFRDTGTLKLSPIQMDSFEKESESPAYLTYSNFLHERYRHCLYARYSDSSEDGQVSLKFALNADGSLAEYKIIDDKSTASRQLQRIAIEALRDAAPFPKLPKELGAPVLTFRVSIHFSQLKEK